MNFSSEVRDEFIVIKVNLQRATFSKAKEFKDYIEKEAEGGALKFIVDLSSCEYLDSTFLGSIISVYKQLYKKGGEVRLVSVNSTIQSILEVTGASRLFDIYKTAEEAEQNFAQE